MEKNQAKVYKLYKNYKIQQRWTIVPVVSFPSVAVPLYDKITFHLTTQPL